MAAPAGGRQRVRHGLRAFDLARPLLHALEPEAAHRLTLWALRAGVARPPRGFDDPALACRLWDLDFPNPVGLAAGFDKNAEVAEPMLDLGFGFVEVGTVTPEPQAGNPRPRVFRLTEDRAVINRLGFNNEGLERVTARLARRRQGGIVGANLGAGRHTSDAIADYVSGLKAVAGLVDYVAINVSSPNTPGLRALQRRAALDALCAAVLAARAEVIPPGGRAIPVLVKIAPDLEPAEREAIAEVALARRIDGIIVANTTLGARHDLHDQRREEAGGLSGAPLFAPSTALLREMYGLVGAAMPLIGIGGIDSGPAAYAKIRAGASLVALYTALVYQGPYFVQTIKDELVRLAQRDGLRRVADAIGVDAG